MPASWERKVHVRFAYGRRSWKAALVTIRVFQIEDIVDKSAGESFKPPYIAFATFWSFISFLAERPLPPRIDRSIMGGRSGTDQAGLISTLKAFSLITEDLKVCPSLTELATSDEVLRQEVLANLIRSHYPGPVAVSEQNGTDQQLHESFRDELGMTAVETRRKCLTFFLHAAREAGLPISAHFPQTRAGSGAPGVPKPKASGKTSSKAKAPPAVAAVAKPTRGDAYSVSLRSGGMVSVEVSVNIFDLSTTDRDFVIQLVDALKGYQQTSDALAVAQAS